MALMYPRTLFGTISRARPRGRSSTRSPSGSTTSGRSSTRWAGSSRTKEKGSDDGEIDFVIAHPEKGLLCLEVKGGGIECQHGEWYGIHDGMRERIKDPFQQALDHRYDLERMLGGMPAKGGGELLIGHAVALPDITVHGLVLAPDAPAGADHRPQRARQRSTRRSSAPSPSTARRGRQPRPGRERDEEAPRAAGAGRPDRGADGGEVPRRGGGADHADPRSGAPAAAPRPRQADGRRPGRAGSGKTMLAVEQAKRVAAKGKRRALRLLQQAPSRPPPQDREGLRRLLPHLPRPLHGARASRPRCRSRSTTAAPTTRLLRARSCRWR